MLFRNVVEGSTFLGRMAGVYGIDVDRLAERCREANVSIQAGSCTAAEILIDAIAIADVARGRISTELIHELYLECASPNDGVFAFLPIRLTGSSERPMIPW